jgi:23S rRNA (guanosine2251-2'-O)-methyltransferase
MVERSQRGKGKQKLLGSHQKCWIWGKHAVLETVRCGKWLPVELHLSDQLSTDQAKETNQLAEKLSVPVTFDSADRLKQLCNSSEHQGYLAKMPPYPYDDAEELLSKHRDQPFYAVLDSIQDPYNFGAILRCAEAMAVDAVFVREQNQVEVTSLVARTSAGAVNHVALARVPNLCELVRKLQNLKISVVAAHENAETNLFDCDFGKSTAVIIGNEGSGIRQELLNVSDQQVRIPQFGNVGSLNAAVSAGILFYEIRRQRSA